MSGGRTQALKSSMRRRADARGRFEWRDVRGGRGRRSSCRWVVADLRAGHYVRSEEEQEAGEEAEAAAINADDSIDSYQYIVEGTPGQFNSADDAGDVNMDVSSTVIADAEADIETDLLAVLSVGDSAGNMHVKVRTLLPEGVSNSGDDAIHGMFDHRGDA